MPERLLGAGRWVIAAAVLLLAVTAPARAADDWQAGWGASAQGPYPKGGINVPLIPLLGDEAEDQTFRNIVRLTAGGARVRVRLSNLQGSVPVTFDGARVARRTRFGAVDGSTDRPLTFAGAPAVTIPAGESRLSDPVDLDTAAGQDLAVTFHVAGRTRGVTYHSLALATSYLSAPLAGDVGRDHDGSDLDLTTVSWFFLDRVDVAGGPARSTVVALGDSITDGSFGPVDSNVRYPDLLARRLGPEFGVVNAGIAGNAISRARSNDPASGPAGIDRLERDVFEAPGVDTLILQAGTNDLSVDVGPQPVIAALDYATRTAQARGICVIGTTLTPRNDGLVPYGWNGARNEAERQAVNAWMRSPEAPFDALADTDAALRWNPDFQRRLDPRYDFGDSLHLNPAGNQAFADALPLDVIRRCAAEDEAAPEGCRRRTRATVRLPAGLRRIRVDGRRVRRGTRRVRVDLRGRTGATARIRVRARRAGGKPFRVTRTVKLCRS